MSETKSAQVQSQYVETLSLPSRSSEHSFSLLPHFVDWMALALCDPSKDVPTRISPSHRLILGPSRWYGFF